MRKRVVCLVLVLVIMLSYSVLCSAGSYYGSYEGQFSPNVASEINSATMGSGTRFCKTQLISINYPSGASTRFNVVVYVVNGSVINSMTYTYPDQTLTRYSLSSSVTMNVGAENRSSGSCKARVYWNYNY